jgi:hypothetical protein
VLKFPIDVIPRFTKESELRRHDRMGRSLITNAECKDFLTNLFRKNRDNFGLIVGQLHSGARCVINISVWREVSKGVEDGRKFCHLFMWLNTWKETRRISLIFISGFLVT